ncbi:hypothetical protein ACHAWF_002575 [Thalassiosira exigua]
MRPVPGPGAGLSLLLFLVARIFRADALSSSSARRPSRRFFVLRHGETDHNASGIIQGSSDASRLTPRGREQAARVGRTAFVRPHAPAADAAVRGAEATTTVRSVFVSPLTRARETLSVVREAAPQGTLPPPDGDVVLDALREIDFYSWEGRDKDELRSEHPEEYAAWEAGDPDRLVVDGRAPLRETWERAGDVWRTVRREVRARASAEEGGRDEHAALLVCHGTLGQALLGSAFGLDATAFRKNDFPNCGMAEVVWRDGDDAAASWRWRHPTPTEHGCLRRQLGLSS